MGNAQRIAMVYGELGGHSLAVMDCATCGEVFAIQSSTDSLRRRDGHGFSCPNGHTCQYSLTETLQQRELKEAQRRMREAEAETARQRDLRRWAEKQAKGAQISAGKARAAKRRLEHRVECGVCPHCQRTFKQLAAHMKTKHASLL